MFWNITVSLVPLPDVSESCLFFPMVDAAVERRCQWSGQWQGRCLTLFLRPNTRTHDDIDGGVEAQPPPASPGAKEEAVPLMANAVARTRK
jgi:hypothetical protein